MCFLSDRFFQPSVVTVFSQCPLLVKSGFTLLSSPAVSGIYIASAFSSLPPSPLPHHPPLFLLPLHPLNLSHSQPWSQPFRPSLTVLPFSVTFHPRHACLKRVYKGRYHFFWCIIMYRETSLLPRNKNQNCTEPVVFSLSPN